MKSRNPEYIGMGNLSVMTAKEPYCLDLYYFFESSFIYSLAVPLISYYAPTYVQPSWILLCDYIIKIHCGLCGDWVLYDCQNYHELRLIQMRSKSRIHSSIFLHLMERISWLSGLLFETQLFSEISQL